MAGEARGQGACRLPHPARASGITPSGARPVLQVHGVLLPEPSRCSDSVRRPRRVARRGRTPEGRLPPLHPHARAAPVRGPESAEAFTDGSGGPHRAALGGRHPGQLPRGLGSARLLLSVSVIFLIQNNSAHPKRTSRRAGRVDGVPGPAASNRPRACRGLATAGAQSVPFTPGAWILQSVAETLLTHFSVSPKWVSGGDGGPVS